VGEEAPVNDSQSITKAHARGVAYYLCACGRPLCGEPHCATLPASTELQFIKTLSLTHFRLGQRTLIPDLQSACLIEAHFFRLSFTSRLMSCPHSSCCGIFTTTVVHISYCLLSRVLHHVSTFNGLHVHPGNHSSHRHGRGSATTISH